MNFKRAAFAVAGLAALCTPSLPAFADQAWPICGHAKRVTCIVDGDTFWMDRTKYRVVGVDAPEAGEGASCGRKRALADEATRALQRLMSAPGLRLERQGQDRYGRVLARVGTAQGDVAANLVRQGLGHAYEGGYRDREQWCRGG